MVKSEISTRLPILKKVILTPTDTTVGFVSQDGKKLADIKSRPSNKPFIKTLQDLKTLKDLSHRVPQKQKNLVRRSKKTTFIIKNIAVRVAKYPLNSQILRNLTWNYSTLANESGKSFDFEFCKSKADIIVQDKNGLRETTASKLYKINSSKKVRLR